MDQRFMPPDGHEAEKTRPAPPIRPFSHPLTHVVAWALVCVLVASWMAVSLLGQSVDAAVEEAPSVALADEMNGRVLLGLHRLDPSLGGILLPELDAWSEGTPVQRLAYTVMVSQLESPESGLERLQLIHDHIDDGSLQISEDFGELLEIVGLLLFASAAGEQATELPNEQQELLEARLGIFGEVLLASSTGEVDREARLNRQLVRGAMAFGAIVIWFVCMGFIGVTVLVVLAIMLALGKLNLRFGPGTATGSVYIETFAIWLLMFFGFTITSQLLLQGLGVDSTDGMLLGALVAFLLSLCALFWPMIRGVRFELMCKEIGLTWGRPGLEVLAGIATYAAALPLLMVGVVCFLLLSWVISTFFGEVPQPSHPIQEAIGSSVTGIVLIYLVACVAAPIVEETMFRGVLYRYLRNSTSRWWWFGSFLISALFSSLVFAMIHPQGIAFIPILGALAVAFCIGREWRGSLIAPMVAHGLSNAVIMTLNVALAA